MYDNHHHHHDSFDQGNGAIGSFKFLDDHVPHLSIRPYHACGDYHNYDDDVDDKSSSHNLSSFSFQVGLHGWILPPGLILLCDMFVYRLFSYVRKIKIFQKGISLLLIPLLHCIFFGKNEIICRLLVKISLSLSMKYFLAASS